MNQNQENPKNPECPEFQWLIVGGGLQGCHFATLLSHQYGRDKVVILDPQPELLQRWLKRSGNCRMNFMRSTSMHHLAPNPGDLLDFAQIHGYGPEHFTEPYLRPSLALFNAHCREVLQNFCLRDLHISGELYQLCRESGPKAGNWLLHYRKTAKTKSEAQSHCLRSQNVLLALGDQGEYWADFANDKSLNHSGSVFVWHLSALDFALEEVLAQARSYQKYRAPQDADICLVGGGISSAQLALYLLQRGWKVQIHSRYPLHSFQFDSEPGWLLKYLPDFHAEPNLEKRWQTIVKERHKGSVPPQLYDALMDYQSSGQLILQREDEQQTDQSIAAAMPTVLATGLDYHTPDWLLQLARELDLPLLHTGQGDKSALKNSLEWHEEKAPGLFLTGRLAELFLGPAAGNIAGARVAARYLPVELEHPGSFLGRC